jgi:DNA adenine methylase
MLRYAGGKTRAIPLLKTYIPADTTEIVSPFLGGGSLELALGIPVHGSDCFAPLIAFWECMKTQREELVQRLRDMHPFTREVYYECRNTLDTGSLLDLAVKFFIVNRCCFSGCITGGYTPSRSPLSCIARLESIDLTNLDVCCRDFEAQLSAYPTLYAFLDPPYDVPNLYGSPEFDHERLARVLRERTSNWLLCYNDTPRIRGLYQEWCDIHSVQWSYGMNASKRSNEILIVPKVYQ